MTLVLFENSFVTLEEAEAYFDERFDSDAWNDATSAPDDITKERLLISASKKINSLDFVGSALEPGQKMVFPRDYALPQDIKDAVCEEAFSMLVKLNDVHKKNLENNISSISLGVGSVKYQAHSDMGEDKVLCSSLARHLLRRWVKKGFLSK